MTAENVEIAALVFTMLVLAYLVYLLQHELRGAAEALRNLVRSHQSLKTDHEKLKAEVQALREERAR